MDIEIKASCNADEWEQVLSLQAASGLEESLPTDGGVVLVKEGNRVLGYCEFILTGQQAMALQFVADEGTMVGLRLGRGALDEMRARGATFCVMACRQDKVRYFTRFGFRVCGFATRYYPSGADAVIMMVDLA